MLAAEYVGGFEGGDITSFANHGFPLVKRRVTVFVFAET
jgi:hypothetical protein